MHNASGDWIGVLIFVGVIAFKIVGQMMEASKRHQAGSPTPRPAQNRPPRQSGDQPIDPMDELLEALGKKPKAESSPTRLPQVPASTQTEEKFRLPQKPAHTFSPVFSESAQPAKPVFTPIVIPIPKEPETEGPGSAGGDTERIEAEITARSNQPVFQTSIGSSTSMVERATRSIANASNAQEEQLVKKVTRPPSLSVTLPELAARLRNPAEIRRAILLNEILSAPVGLRPRDAGFGA